MYSAKRSSKVFISFVWTKAMAPEAVAPTLAQSAARPSPTSTTFASMGPPVDAVPAAETARSGKVLGAIAVTSAVPATQRNGTGKLSVLTQSTPSDSSLALAQSTAWSAPKVPVTRPPMR